MTLNRSKNGMCLETPQLFEPGSILYVEPFNGASDGLDPGSRLHPQIHRPAKDTWCREFLDESNLYYRTGVRFC